MNPEAPSKNFCEKINPGRFVALAVGLVLIGIGITKIPNDPPTKLAAPVAAVETSTSITTPPATATATASASASVVVNLPDIPQEGDGQKVAKVTAEKPPKPRRTYPNCPADRGDVWIKLAEGCNAVRPRQGGTDWLRGATVTCPAGPAKGLQAIEIGPSAPRPMAWGILGNYPGIYDNGNAFRWSQNRAGANTNQGDVYRFVCYGEYPGWPGPPKPW